MAERRPIRHTPDREALRAILLESLEDLRDADDPRRAAEDVMRALDAYIETAPLPVLAEPREPPVMDFTSIREDTTEARWTLWLVLGCGVLATVVAAVVLDGGLVAGIVMIAIWVAVLFSLISS